MRVSAPRRSLEWSRLSERPGPSGYVQVATVTYEMPDGTRADWDLITGPDVVSILALTPDDEVVLARQYRPGPGAVLDELPGGMVDLGESPLTAARRELLEETGYEGTVEIVASFPSGASRTRRSWVAVALGCQKVAEPSPGEHEFIEVIVRPLSELRRSLAAGLGTFTDVGAAYAALDHLNRL